MALVCVYRSAERQEESDRVWGKEVEDEIKEEVRCDGGPHRPW